MYGDGKQVRDILFVEDLLDAYDATVLAGNRAVGCTYNIGGGPTNVLSVLELLKLIEKQQQRKIPYRFGPSRAGDQRVFISDVRRATEELGWAPKIDKTSGLERLYHWICNNETLFLDAPSILAR